MTYCGNCKHWRKIRDEDFVAKDGEVWPGPHGQCHLIDEFSQNKKAWLSVWLGPVESGKPVENAAAEGSLITQSNFGCVMGESKEAK